MVLYVAIVAILNVALGYALAVYLRSAHANRRTANSDLNRIMMKAATMVPAIRIMNELTRMSWKDQ